MRTIPDHNYPAFMAVEAELRRQYPEHEVLNPARNFGGDKTRDVATYLEADLHQVLEADEIVLLPGWENSEGARREIEVAKWTLKGFWLATEAVERVGSNAPERVWLFKALDGPPALDDSPRASALDEARQLITGDRNNQYGPPTQDFDRTAAMASAFGFEVNGEALKGHHVAIFMMLLKTSRLAWTPAKRDSWVDSAGYAGCGYECAVNEAESQVAEPPYDEDTANEALEALRVKLGTASPKPFGFFEWGDVMARLTSTEFHPEWRACKS